jgi:serpin B
MIFITNLPAQDFSEQVKNNNQFSFELFKYIDETQENLFLSPFSASAALAMTYEGARGKTREEMGAVLHFPEDNAKINQQFKDIISRAQTSKDTNDYIFNIANSIWAQQDYKFLQSFFNVIENYYKSPVNNVDFKEDNNREQSRLKINDWVAQRTNNKIQELIQKDNLDKNTRMVLVNAVYFLAKWHQPFNKKLTQTDTFFSFDGKTEKSFMKGDMRINYAEAKGLQMAEIPYKNFKASLVILLPENMAKFNELKANLNNDFFEGLTEDAKQTNVSVTIPKFRIEYRNDLSKVLYDAGMKKPFGTKADFSGMVCDEKVNIDKIIHQSFIDVDESGTEAAAATAVIMKRVTAVGPDKTVEFKADRPFIFLIKEKSTNSILFVGQLMK